MNKKFLADIQIIKNAMNTNKLVIFAGAGISVDAGVPSWYDLISNIKNDLDLSDNEQDFLKIAQIYFNDRKEKEYLEKIRMVLKHKQLRYNEIHEELFELNPEHILTTNFEDLLEQVVSKKSLPFSIIREDKDLPYSNNTKLLVKIHGDLGLGNLVLKEDDYLEYSQNHPLLDSFIKAIFSTKVVLFIGYSFNDYNLKQIIQYVRNVLGKNFQNAYLLSIDKNIHQSHREYLKNKGINVINYFDADFDSNGDKKNYIYEFLKTDNIYANNAIYIDENTSLSEKGQLLLNFLKFIRYYDNLRVKLTKENVINQLYGSLSRFEELKCLPQYFIGKLYPFKTSPKYEHLLEYNTLLLRNESLIDLFYNRIKINDANKLELIDVDKQDREKIEYILRTLNNGLIYFVDKESEKSDNLGYKGFSDNKISVDFHSGNSCDCPKCKYARYEFKECLTKLNHSNISETSDVREDMQLAYLNYKFGNYYKSCNMFEEIASKSWNSGKYLTYYIAKRNMTYIRWIMDYDFTIPEKDKDSLIKKIEDIDIDKLIFQIPYTSDEEYHLLKIIRDDEVLDKAKDKIENYYNSTLQNYKSYKNKGLNSLGPYYPQFIYLELYKLVSFYTENNIILDEYSDFTEVIQKGLEALIINFSTDDRYGGRIKEFESNFFYFAIPYLSPDKFLKILNEYKIKTLPFKKESVTKILTYSRNFLNSFFDKSTWGIITENEMISSQFKVMFFRDRIIERINNLFLCLSLVNLGKEEFESVKEEVFLYLTYSQVSHSTIKYFKRFLMINKENFTLEDTKKLLELIRTKLSKNDRDDLIHPIVVICKKREYTIIEDITYAEKLWNDLKEVDSYSNSYIVYLWAISTELPKQYYYDTIINILKEEFDYELYRYAINYQIIDYSLFIKELVAYANQNIIPLSNNITFDEQGVVQGKRSSREIYEFQNFIYLLYNAGIGSNENGLKKLKSLDDYMKFYIFRNKYNFKNFKISWLYLFDDEDDVVFKELSKINQLKQIIEEQLSKDYNEQLGKIYTKYFLKNNPPN